MFYQLDDHDIWFPKPELADNDGLLAVGGDLRVERLRLAYAHGIFPWYSDETPILWYSPHQRFVLFPSELKISKSMRRLLKKHPYTITKNQAFSEVVAQCAKIERPGQLGTWITQDMQKAYTRLHEAGFASSIEVWQGQQLCGGLYGVICGSRNHVFCGESMFSTYPNTSKLALIYLCQTELYELIDCQVESAHLRSMGAKMINRKTYSTVLNKSMV